jgi:hypothetical protein
MSAILDYGEKNEKPKSRRTEMTLGARKLIVICLAGAVFLIANAMIVADWLEEKGVIDFAGGIRKEFLTGTAITVIVALLILLVRPRAAAAGARSWLGRCPVCDHRLLGGGSYCSECGSRT